MSKIKQKSLMNLRQKTISDYDKIASHFSQTRQFLWPEFKFFKKYLKQNQKILDLGCGNGRLSELILAEKCEYIGMDNSKGQIKEAQKMFPNLDFQIGDLTQIPLPDNSIDQIWSIAAFHHLPDKKSRLRSLKEMQRVLKKNGLIIMTNWNLFQPKYKKFVHKAIWNCIKTFGLKYAWNDTFIPWKTGKINLADRYYHAFTLRELNKLFQKANLETVDSFYTRKGEKVDFKKGFNLCHILKNRSLREVEESRF